MDDKNQLNDIILNKGSSTNGNKKIILAVATLGVILIIVVMLMNSLSSNGTDNLPQAVLPPKPESQATEQVPDEPLFEEVEVVQDKDSNNLDAIAKKLKEESQAETKVAAPEPAPAPKPAPVVKTAPKKVAPAKPKASSPQMATSGSYYIQVGSFSRYEPDKKFLKSITDKGFTYKYHKVTVSSKSLTKVLVGPFKNEAEARSALRVIRSSIEAGAFLTKF
jgi:DedD protein